MIDFYDVGHGRRNLLPMERVRPSSFSCVSQEADSVRYIMIILKRIAVRFIADDQALFVSGLGLVLDATPALGAPRSKVTHPPIGSHPHLTDFFFYVSFRTALCNYRER